MSEYKTIAVGGILVVAVMLLGLISFLLPAKNEVAEAETNEVVLQDVFEDTTLTAKAAIVYDLTTDTVLYGKEEEAQLPLASVTKLLTAYAAVSRLGEEKLISIRGVDLLPEGDSGLLAGETWTVGDLARFTLIESSNDGAQALARLLGEHTDEAPAYALTQTASALSLLQTFALNGSGLDTSEDVSGGYGSAKDMALLLGAIYKEERTLLLDTTTVAKTFTSLDGFPHTARSTNLLVERIPQLVGGKTGFTDLAGGNLAVLVEAAPNRPVAIVVLGSTREGRFSDIEELQKRAVAHFAYQP